MTPQAPPLLRSAPILGPDGQPLAPFLIGPQATFASQFNMPSRSWRWTFDEALKQSPENARAMWRDVFIQKCFQARTRPVIKADWSVVPEDPKNPQQVEVADGIKSVIKAIPNWLQFRYALAKRRWFGRYGVQISSQLRTIQGEQRRCIDQWVPLNGDKITGRWNGVPGIRLSGAVAAAVSERGGHVEPTDLGMVLFLDQPWWRDRFLVGRHEIDDADWSEAELAGGIQGVGLRTYCYWPWWLRQEVFQWLLDYLENMGAGGLTVVYFDANNPKGKAAAQEAFQGQRNTVYVPRTIDPTGKGQDVIRIEPSGTGNEILRGVIDEHLNGDIKELFLGQATSSEGGGEGLGNNAGAKLRGQTLEDILDCDAQADDDMLTTELVEKVQRWNFPGADFKCYFRSSLRKADPGPKLDAAQVCFNLNVPIKAEEVRDAAGFTKPQPGDELVANPEMAGGGPNDAGAATPGALPGTAATEVGSYAQREGPITLDSARHLMTDLGVPPEQHLSGLAAMVDAGQLLEHDAPGGLLYTAGSQGDQPPESGGKPKKPPEPKQYAAFDQLYAHSYARRLKLYAAEDWHQETGPKGGHRWVNSKSGRIVYGSENPGGQERSSERGAMWNREKGKGSGGDVGKPGVEEAGLPRKGRVTGDVAERFSRLVNEGGPTLANGGVLKETAHLDQRLLKDEVVALAGKHGMQITARTTKTGALAFLEEKLWAKAPKAGASPQVGAEGKQAAASPAGGSGSQAVEQAKPAGTPAAGAAPAEAAPALELADAEPDTVLDDATETEPTEAEAAAEPEPPPLEEQLKQHAAAILPELREQAKTYNAAVDHAMQSLRKDAKLSGLSESKMHKRLAQAKQTGDYNAVGGFDTVTNSVASAYPELFGGDELANQEKLMAMIQGGRKTLPTMEDAAELAQQEYEAAQERAAMEGEPPTEDAPDFDPEDLGEHLSMADLDEDELAAAVQAHAAEDDADGTEDGTPPADDSEEPDEVDAGGAEPGQGAEGGAPPGGVQGEGKEPWQMTREQAFRQLDDMRTRDDLKKAGPLLRHIFPDYTEQASPDTANDFAYGIHRMANRGDEIHRIPFNDFTQRHKEAAGRALAAGHPVPPEVLKDYPELALAQPPDPEPLDVGPAGAQHTPESVASLAGEQVETADGRLTQVKRNPDGSYDIAGQTVPPMEAPEVLSQLGAKKTPGLFGSAPAGPAPKITPLALPKQNLKPVAPLDFSGPSRRQEGLPGMEDAGERRQRGAGLLDAKPMPSVAQVTPPPPDDDEKQARGGYDAMMKNPKMRRVLLALARAGTKAAEKRGEQARAEGRTDYARWGSKVHAIEFID